MLIRCVKEFRDLKAIGKPMRAVGETWEADGSRLAEINGAGYGILAEAVEPRAAEEAPAPTAEPETAWWEDMRRAELVDKAEGMGIKVPSKASKRQIAELIGG